MKNYADAVIKASPLQSNFAWFHYFVPNILSMIVCINKFLSINFPSLLPNPIFWSFSQLQSLSQFNTNIKGGSCGTVANSTVFCKNKISCLIQIKKCHWKLSIFVGGVFLVELSFSSKNKDVSRNLYWQQKNKQNIESKRKILIQSWT